MKKQRVTELLPQVAQLTSYPLEVVEEVVQAHYDALKEFLNAPTHAAIHFDYFGKLYTKPAAVRLRVLAAIKEYRLQPSDKAKERITQLYSLYRMSKEYELSRKYKVRFGSWHYKKKEDELRD